MAAPAAVVVPAPRSVPETDGGSGSQALAAGKRTQRVRVPMRLVWSPYYQDVALTAYVKVKALASRPEGCQARTATIASYLGLSTASVERGMTQLRRPGPDGVVEMCSRRRTYSGGRGQSAVRTVRPMGPAEAFVWVPVAAAEDLTPRQLRVYALLAYAQARGIAVTEAELASYLRHHSGRRAGQALTVTAASVVVDEVETARWVTVQRRAGERGRHLYIAHDIAPEARPTVPCPAVGEGPESPVPGVPDGVSSSQVGEGSGSPVGEGSLAYKESPRTDSPDDERAFLSPAVGEVQAVEGAAPVDIPAGGEAVATAGEAGRALRAGEKSRPSSNPVVKNRSGRSGGGSSPGGWQPVMSAEVYALLEPVHHLLAQVSNPFVVRKIVQEVCRQLKDGTGPDRLRHRLTTRFAGASPSEIRDAGRWLLGVALPRWGCGYHDCEAGVIWRTGAPCEICAEIVQDRAAARQRADRQAWSLRPEHGPLPHPAGHYADCVLTDPLHHPSPAPVPYEPAGPPRGSCGECGARIMLTGNALTDGLCKPCREEATTQPPVSPTAATTAAGPIACSGRDGTVPCTRETLPTRTVCLRHRAQELTRQAA
ncbi:hypothetical protein ACF07T_39825 [Streptomyces sp. NPDC015184]|uniref:hypothetical protein n=1 Tax=Streptomyces sp. NPDC015184 TaxID=3364946 RepID=UPI0036FEB01B